MRHMRSFVLAAALIASATVAGSLNYVDNTQPNPTTTPSATQSTAGWMNAEMQDNRYVVGKRRTFQVQQTMREQSRTEMPV